MLYFLLLTDIELSYEGYSEDFDIGCFYCRDEAERVAEYYKKNVKGFCDFPCTYRIIEKKIIGNKIDTLPEEVWTVQGWNENDYFDEIDIVESQCFLTEEQANAELQIMKELYQRKEWSICYYRIGKKGWKDGFIRMVGGEPVN